MNHCGRERTHRFVRNLAPGDYGRFLKMKIHTSDFGYDPFGLERESAMLAFVLFKLLLYKKWFRVESSGAENIPSHGPVIITPNHSGAIPIDGAMLAVDLAEQMEQPRILRAVVDNFAGSLPFINTFFTRCGQVIGARKNLVGLLEQGEMLAVFPEGHKGTGKSFRERYRLCPFNVGFLELSLLHRAPIVPAAVIGAEEQYPGTFNIKQLARWFKLPCLPVPPLLFLLGPLGILPLPTKYTIYYGEPLHFYREYPPETVRDPMAIHELTEKVRAHVQKLVLKGLSQRESVFGVSISRAQRVSAAAREKMKTPKRPQRSRTALEAGIIDLLGPEGNGGPGYPEQERIAVSGERDPCTPMPPFQQREEECSNDERFWYPGPPAESGKNVPHSPPQSPGCR